MLGPIGISVPGAGSAAGKASQYLKDRTNTVGKGGLTDFQTFAVQTQRIPGHIRGEVRRFRELIAHKAFHSGVRKHGHGQNLGFPPVFKRD